MGDDKGFGMSGENVIASTKILPKFTQWVYKRLVFLFYEKKL